MQATVRRRVLALRAKGTRSPVQALAQEYGLSSQEGVALMCMAESLLRIPDRATRDALIRDKVGKGIGAAASANQRSPKPAWLPC